MRLAKNGKGKEITVQNLSDIFVKQQEKGAHNINLVTPTMYVYQIIEAIKLARKTGLKIPIIYITPFTKKWALAKIKYV